MIFSLRDLIPHKSVSTQLENGQWVRAVHEPFRGGLLDRGRDALAVLRGRDVFAFYWPKHGEFERAIKESEDQG